MKIRYRNFIYLFLVSIASVSHGMALSFAPIHDKFDFGISDFTFGVLAFSTMSIIDSLISKYLKKPEEYWEKPSLDMKLFSTKSPLVMLFGIGTVFTVASVFGLIGYFLEVGSISSAYLFFLMGGVICFISAGINYQVFKSHYEKNNNQIQSMPNNGSAD